MLNKWPHITDELGEFILDALKETPLNYGEDSITRDLEEDFAFFQPAKYVIGTCSGSVALWAAYHGIQNYPGIPRTTFYKTDSPEVIMGGYGFWATATAALYTGLIPVFCDVQLKSGNINPDKIEERITPRTIAITVTHISGYPADMDAIMNIAKRHNLKVIEDCAHAHGATINGRHVGTFGDVAVFSLQTLKMMSGGEGGLLSTNDPKIFKRAAELVNVRRLAGEDIDPEPELSLTGLGLKLRISPLSSALASYHLQRLPEFIRLRQRKLRYLTTKLEGIENLVLPHPKIDRGAWYEYTVRIPGSTDMKSELEEQGLEMPASNTRAFYRMPFLGGANAASLPIADQLERETVFLPTFTFETESEIDAYVLNLSAKLLEVWERV